MYQRNVHRLYTIMVYRSCMTFYIYQMELLASWIKTLSLGESAMKGRRHWTRTTLQIFKSQARSLSHAAGAEYLCKTFHSHSERVCHASWMTVKKCLTDWFIALSYLLGIVFSANQICSLPSPIICTLVEESPLWNWSLFFATTYKHGSSCVV